MDKIRLAGLLLLMLTIPLSGCGGGGGGGASPPQQKSAVITFGVISTASLHAVPINGIQFTTKLPAGVTVPIELGTVNVIKSSALAGIKTNVTILGSYSGAVQRVTIGVADTSSIQDGIGLGDFIRLTCTVSSGVTLSENDFKNLNAPFPAFKVSSHDSGTGNTVDLTGSTKPTMAVTFGF